MNYNDTLTYLFDLARFGIKLDLSNTISLTSHLGNPHLKFPSVHVAGSNGKGSVAAMLQSILSKAGYKTGLYTSPHLVDYRERIRIGDELIDKDFILHFVDDLKEEINKNGYTFFEVTTALAFSYFANKEVDIAVLETGMGGRLDSTNIVNPLMSVITSVSLEHTNHLGKTLPQIAFEKAGIIKNGVPTIISVEDTAVFEVIEEVCTQRKSPLGVALNNSGESSVQREQVAEGNLRIHQLSLDRTLFDFGEYKDLQLNLGGRHQAANACLAISAAEKLKEMGWKIDSQAVRDGLKDVNWRGRLEIFRKNPLTLVDVAHNPAGTKALLDALEEFLPKRKLIFIFGVMADKDYTSMLKQICRKTKFIVLTKPDYKRAADPELLEKVLLVAGKPYEIIPKVKQAYIFSLKNAKSRDVICITGSHFTVGEFLSQDIRS
jgi:dihydrofolate synthase/folylpolyglutamate synthase